MLFRIVEHRATSITRPVIGSLRRESSPCRKLLLSKRAWSATFPQQPASQKGRRTMVKTFPALAALVVATALVTPTVGQGAEANSIRVSYADLDLVASFGQNQLERRIAYAAETVCGTAEPRDLAFGRAVTALRHRPVADARP